jgi:hypothetical protein
MRKQSETDPVSLHFASKRKNILCETGAPYSQTPHKPAFMDHFGGRKSEDFAENLLPRISMFTSSRVWSGFGRISPQIRGFQIDYECGLVFQNSRLKDF